MTRNIAGKDIRQLFIYLALQAVTGSKRWNRAGFFNPRKAAVYKFNVEEFVFHVSGGRPPLEVFRELVDFVSSRDVHIEKSF